MKINKIKISEDFSEVPGGRLIKDGKYSGEEFRKNFIIPILDKCIENNEKLIIDFDGGYGYALSFLEESFGGLVRTGYDPKKLLDTLEFISLEEEYIVIRIKDFINNAQN